MASKNCLLNYKYVFFVNFVSIDYTSPLSIRVAIKKDKTALETKTLKYEPPNRKEVSFKEEMSLSTKISKEKSSDPIEDQCKIFLEVYTAKGYKPAGYIDLNIKDYVGLNGKKQNIEVKLKKCADPNARINFDITSKEILEENMSKLF